MAEIPEFDDANIRAGSYYMARAVGHCAVCGATNVLVALALPEKHETLDPESSAGSWQTVDANAFIFFVADLSVSVQRRLHAAAANYRLRYSAETETRYWSNHCEQCGAAFSDHELHCEPGGAFAPGSEEAAARTHLYEIEAPLQASAAGYALQPEFFNRMRRG